MARKQEHLAEVVRSHGNGDATGRIMDVIERGLKAHREREQAARFAAKGTLDKTNPHVSDAGKCPRAVWYSLRNVPESEPLDAASIARFQIGHTFEDWLSGLLAEQGAGHTREAHLSIPAGNTVVTGRRDFDTGALLENEGETWETKATNARSLGFTIREGKPKDGHVRQLNLYLHENGNPKGTIIYFAMGATKGEPLAQAYDVRYDATLALDDLGALAEIYDAAKGDRVIPRPEGNDKAKYPCSYCNFRTTCWGDK